MCNAGASWKWPFSPMFLRMCQLRTTPQPASQGTAETSVAALLHFIRRHERPVIRRHDAARVADVEHLDLLQLQARRLLRVEHVVDPGVPGISGQVAGIG